MLKLMEAQSFCYWLQGFFEISINPRFGLKEIKEIQRYLNQVSESFPFIVWLKEAINVMEVNEYHPPVIAFYKKAITEELNSLFLHVIDPSYDTSYTPDELWTIHQGLPHDE
jgi:hypothetical protein